jgi:acyl phosphate:glycerol-3-phosphate acyltransferase
VVLYVSDAIISYLIGSIPAGYLVGRLVGVDIRRIGSGNIGATNVLRALGKPYGYAVFLFDFFKGVAAVQLSTLLAYRAHSDRELVGIMAGILCVIGHTYPIWLGFRGGKGVATSAGVLFGLMPIAALLVMIVWLVIFQITKYVSVASIGAAVALPLTALLMVSLRRTGMALVYFSICLMVVIIWRHRSNLARLRKGTEQSFKRK